jgi:hypothetical protein
MHRSTLKAVAGDDVPFWVVLCCQVGQRPVVYRAWPDLPPMFPDAVLGDGEQPRQDRLPIGVEPVD